MALHYQEHCECSCWVEGKSVDAIAVESRGCRHLISTFFYVNFKNTII